MRKRVLWHMRTAKAQISLHIRAGWSGPSLSACAVRNVNLYTLRMFEDVHTRMRAVWSGPSLSATRVIRHCRMYQWKANVGIRLCACAVWMWICTLCAYSKTPFRLARPKYASTNNLPWHWGWFTHSDLVRSFSEDQVMVTAGFKSASAQNNNKNQEKEENNTNNTSYWNGYRSHWKNYIQLSKH